MVSEEFARALADTQDFLSRLIYDKDENDITLISKSPNIFTIVSSTNAPTKFLPQAVFVKVQFDTHNNNNIEVFKIISN